MKSRKVRVRPIFHNILVVAALCLFVRGATAQADGPSQRHPESEPAQASIRVRSDLVLVPAFVYDKRSMERVTKAVGQCSRDNAANFSKLGVTQPYLESGCAMGEIQGLSASDFHVLDDGIEQQIQSLTVERWPLVVRDNATWHVEQSVTPSGIWSSADLGGGRVAPSSDQQFYVVTYMPPKSDPGSCHKIEVKVDRPHAVVFARSDYCTGQSPSDPLSGTDSSKEMERDLASEEQGKIDLSLQASLFYTGAETARVDVVLQFPWSQLAHRWNPSSWSLEATIGFLGMVLRKDGTLAARFSDLLYPSYWPMFIHGRTNFPEGTPFNPGKYADPRLLERFLRRWDPVWLPTRYETQLELPADRYALKVVLSDGTKFGRAEVPLNTDTYDGKDPTLSSVVLCKRYRSASAGAQEAAVVNFAPQYVPLVSTGTTFTPSPDTAFRLGEPLMAYFEIYEPALATQPAPTVEAHLRLVDARSGNTKMNFPPLNVALYERPGSVTIPVGLKLPFDQLPDGAYRLEVQATDSAGRSTVWRSADFSVE
jgi:hypothetical protein